MNRIHYLRVLSTAIFVFSLAWSNAQDLHYSQFYNSPQNLNPALTGLYNGDHRFILSHRDQWRYVPVPWTTFSGAYDTNRMLAKSEKTFYGLGGNLNYDRQGDSRLSLIGLSINGALHRTLSKTLIGSIGLNLGFASRGFNTKDLRWDKQWNGDIFNTSSGSGEAFQNTETVNFFDTGLGANLRWQKSNRSYANVGVGIHHIIEPKTAFTSDTDVKLPKRISLSGVGNFKLTEKIDVQAHLLQQVQSKYRETVLGALGKFYVNQQRGKELELHVGLGYRTSGSLIPTLAFQYKNWYLSGNLDIDSTPFNQTLNTSRGAYELHLTHVIQNVKPFRFKNCPIL